MIWECSECGGFVEQERAPVVCCECGTAGVIFTPVEIDDPITGNPEAESLRAAWILAAMGQAQRRESAYMAGSGGRRRAGRLESRRFVPSA